SVSSVKLATACSCDRRPNGVSAVGGWVDRFGRIRSFVGVLPCLHPGGVALSSPGQRPGDSGPPTNHAALKGCHNAVGAETLTPFQGWEVRLPVGPQGAGLGWTMPPLRGKDRPRPWATFCSGPKRGGRRHRVEANRDGLYSSRRRAIKDR